MSQIQEWLNKAQTGEAVDTEALKQKIIDDALRQVFDPEIPVNIYDLGLIYNIEVAEDGVVEVDMTLTAPGCPVAQSFPQTVQDAVNNVEGVMAAHVELVWEPPWTQDRMTDDVKLQLGLL